MADTPSEYLKLRQGTILYKIKEQEHRLQTFLEQRCDAESIAILYGLVERLYAVLGEIEALIPWMEQWEENEARIERKALSSHG